MCEHNYYVAESTLLRDPHHRELAEGGPVPDAVHLGASDLHDTAAAKEDQHRLPLAAMFIRIFGGGAHSKYLSAGWGLCPVPKETLPELKKKSNFQIF